MKKVFPYTVYLKTFDWSRSEAVGCNSIEEVDIVLEYAQDYFYYMIVRRDPRIGDEVIERGQIEHDINKRLVKKH